MALGNKIIASFKEVASHDVRLKRSGTGKVVCSDLHKGRHAFKYCAKKKWGVEGGLEDICFHLENKFLFSTCFD